MAVKYKLSRGTLQSLQQTTSTFAGIVKSFCKALNWDMLALIVAQFQDRIFFGVHQDLIEIMKISVLNGQRARALFDAGYRTLVDISKANVLAIEKCLTDSICFDVQKRDGETNYDAEQRNKHRLLFVTGRAGLSVKEAAKWIIDEARDYLRNEMGIQNINWSQQAESTATNEIIPNKTQAITITKSMVDDRKPAQKRKIPLDQKLVTPHKRRNYCQSVICDGKSSAESCGENSDVDSIIFDNSLSFYNDENDDFMQELRSNNGVGSVLANDECNRVPHLQILDVTKTCNDFEKFTRAFGKVSECGFSLAIARPDISVASKSYRCIVLPELYVNGIAISFHNNYITHFINLQDEGDAVAFDKKIDFIRTMLNRGTLTIVCNDLKSQLKTLLTAIPEIRKIDCLLQDPQVAQWLIQPDDNINRQFSKLV